MIISYKYDCVTSCLVCLQCNHHFYRNTAAQTQSTSSPSKPPICSPKPKVRTDNRLTENISEKCRPSNIAVAYTTLESQVKNGVLGVFAYLLLQHEVVFTQTKFCI